MLPSPAIVILLLSTVTSLLTIISYVTSSPDFITALLGSPIVTVGTTLSIVNPVLSTAIFVLPALSVNVPTPIFSVISPLSFPAVTVATKLVPFPVISTLLPLLPAPLIVTLLLSNATVSFVVISYVTVSPFPMYALLGSPTTTCGATLSRVKPDLVVNLFWFPTRSVNAPASTFNVTAPFPVPPVTVAV